MKVAEYIERRYIRKMAMLEMAYTMETETDAAVVLRMIDDAPAADVAPVVRCEKCEHWDSDPDTYGKDDGPKGKCMKSFETMCADDFCSYGERKENNHEKD